MIGTISTYSQLRVRQLYYTAFTLVLLTLLVGCGGKVIREPVATIVGLTTIRTIDTRTLPIPIREPFSIWMNQYLYITDRTTGELLWCDTTGKRLGGGGSSGERVAGGGYLNGGIAGNLLLCDPQNRKIMRYDLRGVYRNQVLGTLWSGAREIAGPIAALEEADGSLWVVDQVDERLESISPFTAFADSSQFDQSPRRGLNQPGKISRLRNTDMMIANTHGQELVFYDDRGQERGRALLPSGFLPSAATEGRGGILWVLDSDHASLLAITKQGDVKLAAGPLLDGAAEPLHEPTDLVYRFGTSIGSDELVVTDAGAGKIYFLRPLVIAP